MGRVSGEGFAPERETVVEVSGEFPTQEFEALSGGGVARIVNWGVNGETIEAEAAGKCFLVVSEIYSRGWKCYVDGKRTRIYPANYVLLGIPLHAGEYDITLRYLPDGYIIGKYVTIFAILVLTVIGLIYWVSLWRRRDRN